MFKGDSLTVLVALLTMAGGAALTGYSVEGAKRRNLYGVAALFVLLAIGWIALPTGELGTATQVLQRLLALMPIVIVGFVAVMVSSIRSKLDEALAKREEVPVGAPAERERKARHDNLAIRVSNACFDAKRAIGGRYGNPQATVATMESLFATLRRQFAVATPGAAGNDREKLRVYVAYLEGVWPFIRDGNYDEAKARAEKFLADHNGDSAS